MSIWHHDPWYSHISEIFQTSKHLAIENNCFAWSYISFVRFDRFLSILSIRAYLFCRSHDVTTLIYSNACTIVVRFAAHVGSFAWRSGQAGGGDGENRCGPRIVIIAQKLVEFKFHEQWAVNHLGIKQNISMMTIMQWRDASFRWVSWLSFMQCHQCVENPNRAFEIQNSLHSQNKWLKKKRTRLLCMYDVSVIFHETFS